MGKILYLCDGEVEKCNKRNCYKKGKTCRHTSDIEHARNFRKVCTGGFMENETAHENQMQDTSEEI